MPLTAEEEQELSGLQQYFAAKLPLPAAPVAPAPFTRFLQQSANFPSTVGSGFLGSVQGITSLASGIDRDEFSSPQLPRPFDLSNPRGFGENAVDFGTGLASQLVQSVVPGGIVGTAAKGVGLGAGLTSILSDAASGGFLGAQQSGEEAAGQGSEFGLIGAASHYLPPGYRLLANAAIPVTGQLLRGQNPLNQSNLINTATMVALPGLLGQYARPGEVAPPTPEPSANAAEIAGGPLIPFTSNRVQSPTDFNRFNPQAAPLSPAPLIQGGDIGGRIQYGDAGSPLFQPAPQLGMNMAEITGRPLIAPNGEGYNPAPAPAPQGTLPETVRPRDAAYYPIPREAPVAGDTPYVRFGQDEVDPSLTSASADSTPGDLDARMAERDLSTDPEEHHQAVSDAVNGVTDQYPGVNVQVHASFDAIPDEDLKARALEQDPNLRNAEGFNDPTTGIQYVISSNIADVDRAQAVAVHEIVGHHGVDQIIDPSDWRGIQDHVLSKGGNLAEDISQLYHKKSIGDLDESQQRRVTREYVARVAENTNLDPTLWQKVTAAVRKALRAAGINRDWSDVEIQDLVRSAHKNLKSGDGGGDLIAGAVDAAKSESGRDRLHVDHPFYGKETVGSWLDRNGIKEDENGRYTLYHATPKTSAFDSIRSGSYLDTDSNRAAFFAARDRGISAKIGVIVHELKLTADQIEPGIHPTLRGDDYRFPTGQISIKDAYGRLAERTGFPSVAISDLAKESGKPLEEVKSLLRKSHQEGRAILSQGDWSLASPEKRLGAIEANNGYGGAAKNLMVRLLPDVDASLPKRLADSAKGEQQDKPSLLGKFSRALETGLGLSKTNETKLAEEKGFGTQSRLIGQANDSARAYIKERPLITPGNRDAMREFQKTDITPASEAKLRASGVPKTAADLIVTAAKVKDEAQGRIAAAETPEHAATINKSEGYQRRAYQIFTDPAAWKRRLGRGDLSKQIDAAADWAMTRPEFAGADRSTVRSAVAMFARDIADGKDFTMGGDSQKISQSLYLSKKDLAPQQWRMLESLQGDRRLTPSEQDTVKDMVRDQHLKPSDQRFMETLARQKNNGFSDTEKAALNEIGQQETVAPQIRALFGEHTDPLEQAMYTVQKITGSVRQAETIKQIADSSYPDGRKLSYSSAQEYQKALNAATGDSKRALLRYKPLPNSDGYGILSGRWSDVGVGDTLNSMNQGAMAGGNAFLAKLQKVMKLNATVLNPSTHAHWWMQMPLMMSMARVYDPLKWVEAGKIVLGNNRAHDALRDELMNQGILDGGASNEFTGIARKVANIAQPESVFGKIKTGGDKALQYLSQLYGHPDEIIRVASYLNEKGKALADGLGEQSARDRATTFTNRYTFNYKAVPHAVAAASNIPGLNPFLRYSSELTRITKNLAQDVIGGSGADRTHAALNLALMAAVPLAASLGSSSTNLSPEDQAAWDKLRKLEPDDIKGQIKYVIGRKKDGTFNYFDIAPLIPAGDTFNIAKDILKGDWKAFAEDQPLIGLSHSPIASLGVDLSTGTNQATGQKLYTAGDYAQRIAQPLLPPVLGSQLQRDIRSFSTNAQGGTGVSNPRTGREDTPVTSLLGHVGLRLNSENQGVLIRTAQADSSEKKEQAQQQLRSILGTNASDDTKQKAILKFQARSQDIQRELLGKISG